MERYGSFQSGPHSFAIFIMRSIMSCLELPRTRSNRSRIASLTAAVMLSPVARASSRAMRWGFSSLIFKLMVPFVLYDLPFYHKSYALRNLVSLSANLGRLHPFHYVEPRHTAVGGCFWFRRVGTRYRLLKIGEG